MHNTDCLNLTVEKEFLMLEIEEEAAAGQMWRNKLEDLWPCVK